MHTRRGVGALAIQALMNPLYGPAGMALPAAGHSISEVIGELIGADDGRPHALLTFGRCARKDSSHAFRVDVERQECQRHSARVSPLVHETEGFVDQGTGWLGVQLSFDRVCARSGDDVIKRRA